MSEILSGPTDGVLNLLKPAGMTSHDCVSFLRRITHIRAIGHAGTLDPMAAGVLPLCIGRGTRLVEYMDLEGKSYRCEMLFGLETDTLDIWGKVLNDRRTGMTFPSEDAVREALKAFEGDISQYPPLYSAIRVDGRRLYEYARKGKTPDIQPRSVRIDSITLLSYNQAEGRLMFDVACSKGTYIRSICRDLGEALGCGGAMSFLLRTSSGPFSVENAVTMEEAEADWQFRLFPLDYPLVHFGKILLDKDASLRFCCGTLIGKKESLVEAEPDALAQEDERFRLAYRMYGNPGGGESSPEFLGVAFYRPDTEEYKAHKVFFR